jgi:hypothetical protein
MPRPLLLVALSTLPAAAPTGSGPFTGTWVADLDSQSGLGQDVYLVAKGNYRCTSCTPPRSYPADGKLRPIGDEEGTKESVTVTGPGTIVTRIVEPAITRTTTMTVASDNRTATYVSLDHRPGIRQTLKTVYVARRVASGPRGSHRVSGTWQGLRYESVPELVRTTELGQTGDQFSYRAPIGSSYSAILGGPPVPVKGPYRGAIRAAVKLVDQHKIVETRTEDGEVILVRTFTLSPDERALTIASTNPATNTTFVIMAHRK